MTKPKTLDQLRAEKERAETQLAQEKHKLERLENRKKYLEKWCCTIKVDIENSKGQYIEKDKQEATKDGSESTKIQHGI